MCISGQKALDELENPIKSSKTCYTSWMMIDIYYLATNIVVRYVDDTFGAILNIFLKIDDFRRFLMIFHTRISKNKKQHFRPQKFIRVLYNTTVAQI